MNTKRDTAILMMHCQEKRGIVHAVTGFILDNNGVLIQLDQHVDHDEDHFFMRVEWNLKDFDIEKEKISDYFETLIVKKFGDIYWELHIDKTPPKMALFVSKYAHCFHDILSRFESKEWQIEIPVIISNHEDFRSVADRHDIPYHYIPIKKDNKKVQEEKTIELLREYDVDFIVLARYMQILSGNFVDQFPNRIINIHHSSLPAFPGANPYKAAYQRGVKFMGATGHYVTTELDGGPIIAQDVIPISHRNSYSDLKRKGKNIEKIVLANAVWAHLNHKIITYKNKTVVFE